MGAKHLVAAAASPQSTIVSEITGFRSGRTEVLPRRILGEFSTRALLC
jgi:hypothetical protein